MTTQKDITRQVFKHHKVSFTSNAFTAFWELGYSVLAIKDEDCSLDNLLGDTYNPVVNPYLTPEQLRNERIKEVRRIRERGVWGCGLALNGVPDYSTFIWGMVGDDFIGSGYDDELIAFLSEKGAQND